jgi:quercetin dioxygenase-like cupin family protein
VETAPAGPLWFLDTLVQIRVPHAQGTDGLSVLEHRARWHDSPPLHVHRTEDELFQILEGEFHFHIGQQQRRCTAGDVLLIPKGTPHTYRIESPSGGHWITVTTQGDFERFVRAFSRPAAQPDLPPRGTPPTPEQIAALTDTARQFHIDVVGPPLC